MEGINVESVIFTGAFDAFCGFWPIINQWCATCKFKNFTDIVHMYMSSFEIPENARPIKNWYVPIFLYSFTMDIRLNELFIGLNKVLSLYVLSNVSAVQLY